MNILISLIETAVAVFLVWGLFHEQKLVEIEGRIFKRQKRYKTKMRPAPMVLHRNPKKGYSQRRDLKLIS